MFKSASKYLDRMTQAAPLAVFRIFFGLMMFISLVRFWNNGWIDKLYVKPKFFFKYYGFGWVSPIGEFTYIIFLVCAIAAMFVAIGFKYRASIIIFFLSFSYIELMDKTTYLNHYYFISCLSFLLIFLPANAYFSVDSRRNSRLRSQFIPKWCIDSIKLMLAIVYLYAGLAKLNSDWLLKAMPLKIWLPSKYDLPFLGNFFQQEWTHYVFSWSGMLYDLAIPFLLLYKPTRWFAFIMVVIFHVLTAVLFPIGMFPYVMIVSALIFFDAEFHEKIILFVSKILKIENIQKPTLNDFNFKLTKSFGIPIVTVFFIFQLILPWRYLAYPGELFWTEEGYRFSWRVMLMEKAGFVQLKVVDGVTGKRFYVDNKDFLTAFQEKQMSTQPDFIVQYAHYLENHFAAQGHKNIQIYAESYVALNGRLSQSYIDPKVDLVKVCDDFSHKNWILPFNDKIQGL